MIRRISTLIWARGTARAGLTGRAAAQTIAGMIRIFILACAGLCAACTAPVGPVSLQAAAEAPDMAEPGGGDILMAKVEGLASAGRAEEVRAAFSEEEAVLKVYIDLAKDQVRIDLKSGKSMDDAAITELFRKSGYTEVSIDRSVAY